MRCRRHKRYRGERKPQDGCLKCKDIYEAVNGRVAKRKTR